eukprot:14435-Amphidinium_carterae.1
MSCSCTWEDHDSSRILNLFAVLWELSRDSSAGSARQPLKSWLESIRRGARASPRLVAHHCGYPWQESEAYQTTSE